MSKGFLRENRGRLGHLAGAAAEDSVARRYQAQGMQLLHQRWRGKAGEIDLILRNAAQIVFVEVKKSQSFPQAAAALKPAQIQRLMRAGEEFMGNEPMGLLTEARFDVALLDAQGRIEILENALVSP